MGNPTALVVQHIDYEAPYTIASALERAGVGVRTWGTWTGEPVPRAADCDALVVMGGSPSAFSDDGFPTRGAELALIAACVDAGKPVLGVCLGAQLIAHACGGEAVAGDGGPEVGWSPVRLVEPGAATDPLFGGLPARFPALHWHRNTFVRPPAAVLLASTDRYENQAFRLHDHVWGIQFHIEVDARAVAAFCREDPEGAGAGDGADTILRATPEALRLVEPTRDHVFDRFAALVTR